MKRVWAMESLNPVRSVRANVVHVAQPEAGQDSDLMSDQFQIQGEVGNEVEDAPNPEGEENGT